MYLYIELWKAKDTWVKLTFAERSEKINQLLQYVKERPIAGVMPFSFRKVGDVYLYDGLAEERVVLAGAAARPSGFRYAAAWMAPTVDLVQQLEQRVKNVGWWFDYFEWKNAWGAMDVAATVADMLGGPYSGHTDPFEGTTAGQERDGFCWCPPGSFKMGFEQTEVTLSRGFWMSKNLVTQEQYKSLMGDNPSGFVGPNLPVESVNKNQVLAYCSALTGRERAAGRLPAGWAYRLPTEAQWEYAARAGTTTAYYWGDDVSHADDYVWHIRNSGFKSHPVGGKKPNPWGLHDTLGNCIEWCRDAWVERYPGGADPEVTEEDLPDRPGESGGPFGVSHGGGWFIPPEVPPQVRIRQGCGDQGYLLGFRVAIVRDQEKESIGHKRLKEWGDIMAGRWVSEGPGGQKGEALEVHSSARWIMDNSALEGEFQVGNLRGKWLTNWDAGAREIKQYTVDSSGSTVQILISKRGGKWIWRETALRANGQRETGIDTVTVAEGGNKLVHEITNRMSDGNRLPDILSVLKRVV